MTKIVKEEEYSAYNKIMLMTKSSLWKGEKKSNIKNNVMKKRR